MGAPGLNRVNRVAGNLKPRETPAVNGRLEGGHLKTKPGVFMFGIITQLRGNKKGWPPETTTLSANPL